MSERILQVETGILRLSCVPIQYGALGVDHSISATVSYNDDCNNGHKTFYMTAEIRDIRRRREVAGGCLHEEIAKAYPGMEQYIKWHGCSTDGPMHYIENTMYWLGRRGYTSGKPGDPPNLAYARKCAVWPDMPEGYVITGTLVSNKEIEQALADRLPGLLIDFRKAVESLGFVY